MSDTTGTFVSLATLYEKQYQDQSSVILKGASYAFRSRENHNLIEQALAVINTLCAKADTTVTEELGAQVIQHADALAKLLATIQTADRKAIAKRAMLDQGPLKKDAEALQAADASLIANLKKLGEDMTNSVSDTQEETTPPSDVPPEDKPGPEPETPKAEPPEEPPVAPSETQDELMAKIAADLGTQKSLLSEKELEEDEADSGESEPDE